MAQITLSIIYICTDFGIALLREGTLTQLEILVRILPNSIFTFYF